MAHCQFRPYQLDFPSLCRICGKQIKSKSGLGTHIKNQHSDYSYKSYLLMYEKIDLDNLEREWDSKKEERKRLGHQKSTANNKYNFLSPRERFTEEKYKKWRKNMSKVFTKEWFVEKYGEKEGLKKYRERSEEISKKSSFRVFNKKNKKNWSKISQRLFWELKSRTNFKKIYFGELNHEHSCGTQRNFDFVVLDNKKVIEFNGDKWHANPNIFSANDTPMPHLNKTAREVWDEDDKKTKRAIFKGYEVKAVWESDYVKNEEKTILECVDFLVQ